MSEAIKDGFYGFIGGTVADVFLAKTGQALKVEVKDERSEFPTRVTVWGVNGEFAKGDRVKLKGWVKVKAATWAKSDGSQGYGVDVSVNQAEVVAHESVFAAAPQAPQLGESAPF